MKRFLFIMVWSCFLFAQSPKSLRNRGGIVRGYVLDERDSSPLEYASVILYSEDGKQVLGISTDKEGFFILKGIKRGKYNLEVDFIGYKKKIFPISITKEKRVVRLRYIYLSPASLSIGTVEVKDKKPAIVYKIDKKVVYVNRLMTAKAGTAVDVLREVPSVDVDIEDNITIRGSDKFTLLIDGRPTVMNANDALKTIPADIIEKIEVITNPSAKYDPEGIAGILNIVLKKKHSQGLSGRLGVHAGSFYNAGGLCYLNLKRGMFNNYIAVNVGKRSFPGFLDRVQRIITDTTEHSYGTFERNFMPMGFRGGVDMFFNPENIAGIGGGVSLFKFFMNKELDVYEVYERDSILFKENGVWKAENINYELFSNYTHKFHNNGHKIQAEISYNTNKREGSSIEERYNGNEEVVDGRQTKDYTNKNNLRIKTDYTLPITDSSKFEAGYQANLHKSAVMNVYLTYDTLSKEYIDITKDDSLLKYERDIQSLYTMYNGGFRNFSYQFGLRVEYTYRSMIDTAEVFKMSEFAYFPTIHTSYNFNTNFQVMIGYSRRIHRPHERALDPNIRWMGKSNVRIGNPKLKPEYIDVVEGGFQSYFSSGRMSVNMFFHKVNNLIERIESVYAPGVVLHTSENIGEEYRLGMEGMIRKRFLRIINVSLNMNVRNKRIVEEDSIITGFDWSGAFRMSMGIKGWGGQISIRYNAPTNTSQGERNYYFSLDMAYKQNILKAMAVSLIFRDVLHTANREFMLDNGEVYSHTLFKRAYPFIMLSFEYSFNNFKKKKEPSFRENSGEDFDYIY